MKLHQTIFQILTATFLLAGVLLFTSCEKSENAVDNSTPANEDGKCLLLPPTISIAPFGSDSFATRADAKTAPEEQCFNVGEELCNTLAIENTPETDTPATRALASGTYFRMVICKKSDWDGHSLEIIEQRLCKIGSDNYYDTAGNQITVPVLLTAGDYKVFCYSFNKTDTPIPELTNDNITVLDGEDFLSQLADLTITAGSNNISLPIIVLQHRCCKITATLTAEYFDNNNIASTPAPSLSISHTPKAASWDIFLSTIRGDNSKDTPQNFQLSSVTIGGQINYSGSIIILPAEDWTLTASYSFKPESASEAVTVSNKLLTAKTGYNFISGNNYTFTTKAINAYTLSDNAASIGGSGWKAANITGSRGWADNPWSGGWADGDNAYWRWGQREVDLSSSATDGLFISEWEQLPCDVPYDSYLRRLVDKRLIDKKIYINGEMKQTNGYGWLDASGSRAAGMVFYEGSANVIFLPAAGYRYGSSFREVGSEGYYWSGRKYNNTQAYCLHFNNGRCEITPQSIGNGYSLRCQ